MPTWKKIIVSGSNAHLSTVTASAFTASAVANAVGFFGTASWAQSASQAISASYVNGNIHTSTNPALSASFALTASFALNASTPTLVTSASVVAVHNSSSANGTYYPTFVDATSGYPSQSVDTDLTYNPNTNTLSAGNITLSGDIAVNGGDITTNATTFNLLSGATTAINIGATSTNVVIPGNLSVQGTTTTISSSNLLVADRFILLASGSTSATDGGIVIQSGSAGDGYAYFLDAIASPNSPRWGFTSSFLASTTTATPDEYAVTARTGSGDPTNAPTYGGSGFGHGNIYVNGAGDIWIYS